MNAPFQLHRRRERHFSAHHMLLRTAQRAVGNAQRSQVGSRYEFLIAVVFAALAVESLANTLLERLLSDWKKYERRSPMRKIQLAATALGLPYEPANEPWSSGIWLFELRNRLAHAWPEHLLSEDILSQEQYDDACFEQLESELELELNLGSAERALTAAQLIHHRLALAVPEDQRLGILVDGSTQQVRRG